MMVVIAGGASGLGLATAELALARGARGVGLIDRNAAVLEQVANSFRGEGFLVATAVADISTSRAAHGAFKVVADSLGRIDSLINCVAIYPRRPLLEITDDDWDLENAVNIKGSYHLMVAAVLHMRRFAAPPAITGRIVNVTSVDAFKAHPQNAHYAATKAAVVSLTKSFAEEFASEQILVNSVAPAGFATDRAKQSGFLGELAAANPLGRAAEPAEIAEWILMLAGERNTYATGENVVVSGGYIYV